MAYVFHREGMIWRRIDLIHELGEQSVTLLQMALGWLDFGRVDKRARVIDVCVDDIIDTHQNLFKVSDCVVLVCVDMVTKFASCQIQCVDALLHIRTCDEPFWIDMSGFEFMASSEFKRDADEYVEEDDHGPCHRDQGHDKAQWCFIRRMGYHGFLDAPAWVKGVSLR